MRLANLSKATRQALAAILPPAASLNDPVDMLASASPEQYASCLQILLKDPEVDGVMVILPPPPMYTAGAVAKAIIPVIHPSGKPVVVALMGERLIQEAVEHLRAAHVPEYRFPERAASALAALAERAEYIARCGVQTQPQECQSASARLIFDEYLNSPDRSGKWLPSGLIEKLLKYYDISISTQSQASSAEQAGELASQAGFPVVLKVASPDISHKSDVNGVLLNLWSKPAAIQGFAQVIENARSARPQARIEGVTVQHMLPPGQDVIIGALQDPQFGPLVMFGAGGVEAEELKDVAFALAPLSKEEARFLLESTWAGRKLKGYRNLPPTDSEAVIQVLQRFACLAADFPELAEIEIQPPARARRGRGCDRPRRARPIGLIQMTSLGFEYHPDILAHFPHICGGVILLRGFANGPTPSGLLEAYLGEQHAVIEKIGAQPLSEIVSLAGWRAAFRQFGVDPTKYRSAAESLLRRLTKKGDIPSINALVDLCNLISIRYALPVAAFDLRQVNGLITVQFAAGDETFIAHDSPEPEHPETGEVVFVDEAGLVVARRWCWKQSAESTVSLDTRDVIITTEAQHQEGEGEIQAALDELAKSLEKYMPGNFSQAILNSKRPALIYSG